MISFGFALWNYFFFSSFLAVRRGAAHGSYHYKFTSMENPNGKKVSEEAAKLFVLYSHLIKEVIVIVAHDNIDLRKAKVCTFQTL